MQILEWEAVGIEVRMTDLEESMLVMQKEWEKHKDEDHLQFSPV